MGFGDEQDTTHTHGLKLVKQLAHYGGVGRSRGLEENLSSYLHLPERLGITLLEVDWDSS